MRSLAEWAIARLPREIQRALLQRQTIALEYSLGYQAFVWGLWVAAPSSTAFLLLEGSASVIAVVPEWVCGLVFATHGALYMRAVRISVRQKRPDGARRGAKITVGLWTFILVTFLMTVPASAVIIVYFTNASLAMWVSFRMARRFPKKVDP